MRREETATIGRRLTHIRAHDSQKTQASRLGVAERTYQNYELDSRAPDLRTLLGAFMQGWDLNWLVCGVGAQRLDPRAVIEYMLVETTPPTPQRSRETLAAMLRSAYNHGDFTVPPWVYAEFPALGSEDAEAIVDGTWALQPPPSQALQQTSVRLAAKLLHEALDDANVRITPDQAGEATSILAQLLESGLSEAKVRPHARQLTHTYGAGGSDAGTEGAGGQATGDHARGGTA